MLGYGRIRQIHPVRGKGAGHNKNAAPEQSGAALFFRTEFQKLIRLNFKHVGDVEKQVNRQTAVHIG